MKFLAFYSLILILSLSLYSCKSSDNPAAPEPLDCNTNFNPNDFPAATVSFVQDVFPILQNHNCDNIDCHGGGASSYSVSSAISILGPGEQSQSLGYCNVIRGDPSGSYLIMKLTNAQGITGKQMPYEDTPLTSVEIAVIQQWIIEGARDN